MSSVWAGPGGLPGGVSGVWVGEMLLGKDAWALAHSWTEFLGYGPFFSKKGEAVCGKQPWGLFIEVTGNPQRVRTSPSGWTTGSASYSLTGTQPLLGSPGGMEMGRTPAWRSQNYRIRAGKREGWGPRGTQREQELCLGHLGGLPGGEISRAGPWEKKNLRARKRHSSPRAQHKSH